MRIDDAMPERRHQVLVVGGGTAGWVAALTPDHGDSIPDLIPTIARIQAHKSVIVRGYLSAEEVRMIVEGVPPEGLCVISRVDTPEGALRLQDAIL